MFVKNSRFSATGSTSIRASSSGGASWVGRKPFPIVKLKAKATTAAVAIAGTGDGWHNDGNFRHYDFFPLVSASFCRISRL